MGQGFDVDAASRDISGHEYAQVTRFKLAQGTLTGGLALVAVNGQCTDAAFIELFR
jgi:hypothetical protein